MRKCVDHCAGVRFGAVAAALAIGCAATLSMGAASLSVTGNSTTGSFAAWPTTPNAGDSTAVNANISGFNSAEGNFGSGPPSGGSLGQSFLATQSGSLSDIEFLISGTAPITFNANLFDAGVTTQLSDTGNNSYGNGTPNGGVAVPVGANLLPASSQGLVWNGFTLSGATAAALDIHLDPGDVSLVAGHEYVFELATPSATTFFWLRMANNAIDYANGQAFRSRAPLNGNPARDLSIGVVVAPEPASLGVFGLTTLGALVRRRRR